ncbi:deoxyuridine 5'-triphosphate nucleotidohydrolase [Candidatus Uhrbacteria bacterium]|nr:deoxyuridine 5'-triphosphate nucleotidohydrolase [Candidatus Uhrbacteria bacterium]MBD3284189.1 deoxyuridine 5'-triphosphate nucleotidohydrolase [Candidatus Uhrbacteria bacterium]
MEIKITKIDPRAVIPTYGTPGSAAFDLTAIEDTTIQPNEQVLIRTGLVFGIPPGHVQLVFSRSSSFKKFGFILSNGVGIIDSDYCGPEDELFIAAMNPGPEPLQINAGSRVAQSLILPYPKISFVEGAADGPNRGNFGSTGGHGDVSV